MARVIDITDKLGMGGRPKIVIGGEEFEVDDSAPNVLEIIGDMDGREVSAEVVSKVYGKLFPPKERKRLDALGLSFADFTTVIEAALDLIVGDGADEGNAETPATT